MNPQAKDAAEPFVPATADELSRFVSERTAVEAPAFESPAAIYPCGGRTALNFGYPPTIEGVEVSTAKLAKVIDYPARDMTITVEAGIRIDELIETLKGENQRLAVDIAQSHRATLGGAVATNTSGPRRFGCGTMRDYVIGISAVDARGRLFSAGGRVVKNVAGYDLCKMLVGSMGTLAIITQLTLKLRPMPETSAFVWATFASFADIDAALERLTTSETRPVAVEVLNSLAANQIVSEARCDVPADLPVLCIAFEGSQRETDWQTETLRNELATFNPGDMHVIATDGADGLWQALIEYQTFADAPLTFQANMLPSETPAFVELATGHGVSIQAHAGNGIVIGQLPDETATVDAARQLITPLRQSTRQARGRGNLVISHCNSEWKSELPVFGDPEPSWPLMQELKKQLDPYNLLNPGRFIDGSRL